MYPMFSIGVFSVEPKDPFEVFHNKNDRRTISAIVEYDSAQGRFHSIQAGFFLWFAKGLNKAFGKEKYSTLASVARNGRMDAASNYETFDGVRKGMLTSFGHPFTEWEYDSQKEFCKVGGGIFLSLRFLNKKEQKTIIQSLRYAGKSWYGYCIRSRVWNNANRFHKKFRADIISDAISHCYSSNPYARRWAIEAIAEAQVSGCLNKGHKRAIRSLDEPFNSLIGEATEKLAELKNITGTEKPKTAPVDRVIERHVREAKHATPTEKQRLLPDRPRNSGRGG